jgi:DNA repair exonuclease SbcCD ATPase subunit
MVEKRGLFPKKPVPQEPARMASVTTTDLAARLRIYEGRYSELRKNLVVIEQNMLSNHKKINRDIKDIYSELSELRRQITEIQDNITKIIKELQLLATKSEVKVLAKVIDYLDPIKFVRIDQMENIVNDIVDAREEKEEDKEESVPKPAKNT